MRNRILFALAAIGVLAGLISALVFAVRSRPLSPVFAPAANPYEHGVYANGIIESLQESGENINVYPEVGGTVIEIVVHEGSRVTRGATLVRLDDSIQRATAEQLQAQADAAFAMLEELRAQPRPENLEIARAQVRAAERSLKSADDDRAKQQQAYDTMPDSVSKMVLDQAINATELARANLAVAQRNYELVKAGAWSYDIRNQEAQYNALTKGAAAARALLAKYTVTAPVDGVVLSITATVGSYASPQGTLESYSAGTAPLLVMGTGDDYVAVRCYVDEILIAKLHDLENLEATMFIRGTDVKIPLEFVRVQPLVSPKIELSNQRTERVDVRVLPIIFRFKKPENVLIYPGQLVDVYMRSP
ncbi:MAG TPA: glycosyl hydrolase family 18 [Deltaproteobacteria bacterium]|nr:glycosyl hydrolase family 18 [Deltaproteobacteria bacterium]